MLDVSGSFESGEAVKVKDPDNMIRTFFFSFIINIDTTTIMNGRLDKVAMTSKLMQLKRELHYKCEIGEKNEGYCRGANDYLNRTFDVLDEFWQ